jgi:hypothetical protein
MDISLEIEQEIKYTQERLLGELYAEFLGPEFSSVHTGRENESADCLIVKNANSYATIEISGHMDENEEIAMSHMVKVSQELKFESDNFGKWALTIPSGNPSKKFTPNLVRDLCIKLDHVLSTCECVRHEWECSSQKALTIELGLTAARKVSNGIGGAYLFLSSDAFIVDQDPDLFVKFLTNYFSQQKITKKLKKLENRAFDTRRTYILTVGSATDRSVLSRMCHSRSEDEFILPTSSFSLPANLDEVALVCFGSGRMLHFSHEQEWSLFEPDHDQWNKKLGRAFADAGHPTYISWSQQGDSIVEDV